MKANVAFFKEEVSPLVLNNVFNQVITDYAHNSNIAFETGNTSAHHACDMSQKAIYEVIMLLQDSIRRSSI